MSQRDVPNVFVLQDALTDATRQLEKLSGFAKVNIDCSGIANNPEHQKLWFEAIRLKEKIEKATEQANSENITALEMKHEELKADARAKKENYEKIAANEGYWRNVVENARIAFDESNTRFAAIQSHGPKASDYPTRQEIAAHAQAVRDAQLDMERAKEAFINASGPLGLFSEWNQAQRTAHEAYVHAAKAEAELRRRLEALRAASTKPVDPNDPNASQNASVGLGFTSAAI